MSFISQYEHVLDAKGRTSIPARFREILAERYDERLIVTVEQAGCLAAHPFLAWQALLERLRQLPKTDKAVRAYKLVHLGQAQDVSVDKQGRILLPPALRHKAALRKKITFVGQDDHFQIWDSKSHQQAVADKEQFLEENPDRLSDLGL